MSIDKPLEEKSRIAIRDVCQRMKRGEVSFIEGTRQVLVYSTDARLAADDPDLVVFVGIASETDVVPNAKQLEAWSQVAASKHAATWEELESWAKDYGSTACGNFISRF